MPREKCICFNLRSCPRGRHLETARAFENFASIFLGWEKIFPSVKLGINPPLYRHKKEPVQILMSTKRTKEKQKNEKDHL